MHNNNTISEYFGYWPLFFISHPKKYTVIRDNIHSASCWTSSIYLYTLSGHLVPSRFGGLHVLRLLRPVSRLYIDFGLPKLTFTELRRFHGSLATGVWHASRERLPFPTPGSVPPLWDLHVLQSLRPDSSNLPCLYSTFNLEYPLILSRFCL